jgi:hypothetical protein
MRVYEWICLYCNEIAEVQNLREQMGILAEFCICDHQIKSQEKDNNATTATSGTKDGKGAPQPVCYVIPYPPLL